MNTRSKRRSQLKSNELAKAAHESLLGRSVSVSIGVRAGAVLAVSLLAMRPAAAVGLRGQSGTGHEPHADAEKESGAHDQWQKIMDAVERSSQGAWVIESYHGVRALNGAAAPGVEDHLESLTEHWDHQADGDQQWVEMNGFDSPESAKGHPLLRGQDAWESSQREFLIRATSAQRHRIIGPASQSNQETRKVTTQYRQDGVIIEELEYPGYPTQTRILMPGAGPRMESLLGRPVVEGQYPTFESWGVLAHMEQVAYNAERIIAATASGTEGRTWSTSPSEWHARVELDSLSARSAVPGLLLPFGFERVPGYAVLVMEQGRQGPDPSPFGFELHWLDSLGEVYCKQSVTWKPSGGFSIRDELFYPGTEEVAVLRTSTALVDSTQELNESAARWIPKLGQPVKDLRGDNPVMYVVGEDLELLSLASLQAPNIYTRPPGPMASGIQLVHELVEFEDPIQVSPDATAGKLDLGEVAMGDTPFRVKLWNVSESPMTVLSVTADCGCLQLQPEYSVIGPGELSGLYGVVAVRIPGQAQRAVRIAYMLGSDGIAREFDLGLDLDCPGAFAVAPEHVYLGKVIRGDSMSTRFRVVTSEASLLDGLEVTSEGEACDVEVHPSEESGFAWVEVGVEVADLPVGEVDRHLRFTLGDESSVVTLSYSSVPSAQLFEVWPVLRIPLSVIGEAYVRIPVPGGGGLSFPDDPMLRIEPDASGAGYLLRSRDAKGLDGSVHVLRAQSEWGELQILVR